MISVGISIACVEPDLPVMLIEYGRLGAKPIYFLIP